MLSKALFLSLCVSVLIYQNVEAGCPNACSGKGECGDDDTCQCFKGWKGGDCSYRQCAYGLSWSVTSTAHLNDDRMTSSIQGSSPGAANVQGLPINVIGDRQYAECSNRGICDSSTGLCKCFAGYEGKGCRRAKCPNDCSGHGRCIISANSDESYRSKTSFNDGLWDQDKTQWCKCDRGYTGYDCNERICPLGDNPSTKCDDTSSEDIQLVYLQADTSASAGKGYFSLDFTDRFGGTFTSRPIDISKCTAGSPCPEAQQALMALPNFAIPDIQVEEIKHAGIDASVGQHAYFIRFTDHSNAGKQNTLKCNSIADSMVAGASPTFKRTPFCTVVHVGQPEWSQSQSGSISLNGKQYFYNDLFTENIVATHSTCNALNKDCKLQTGTISGANPAAGTVVSSTANSLEECVSAVSKSKFVFSATGLQLEGKKCTAFVGGTFSAGAGTKAACAFTRTSCARSYEEYVPCSNQGECNTETGVCKCLGGAHGSACNLQNTYA